MRATTGTAIRTRAGAGDRREADHDDDLRADLRTVATERLGLVPDEMEGGHFPMLSRPVELADRLEGYSMTTAG